MKFFDWQLALVMGVCLIVCWVEWEVDGHMGPGEEFELGEVKAHGATNKH